VRSAGVPAGGTRAPPELARILAAHPLMHSAEGELYREVLVEAAADAGLTVSRVPGRDLAAHAASRMGCDAAAIAVKLTELGRQVGRPWRRDEKDAALAAWLALGVPLKCATETVR
jgi:hypothetical protein